jgi:Fe-S-cluster-containing hydrogenase component 2
MINVYKWAVIETTQDEWIMMYDDATKIILVEPSQCSGSHTCAITLVVADTKEELDQYIVDNALVYENPGAE